MEIQKALSAIFFVNLEHTVRIWKMDYCLLGAVDLVHLCTMRYTLCSGYLAKKAEKVG
jgi:hypothetical protein